MTLPNFHGQVYHFSCLPIARQIDGISIECLNRGIAPVSVKVMLRGMGTMAEEMMGGGEDGGWVLKGRDLDLGMREWVLAGDIERLYGGCGSFDSEVRVS
jgi:hypothetical protein